MLVFTVHVTHDMLVTLSYATLLL